MKELDAEFLKRIKEGTQDCMVQAICLLSDIANQRLETLTKAQEEGTRLVLENRELKDEIKRQAAEEKRLNDFCELKKDELDGACDLIKERDAEIDRLMGTDPEDKKVIEKLREEVAILRELAEALENVLKLSDRKHQVWIHAWAVLGKLK